MHPASRAIVAFRAAADAAVEPAGAIHGFDDPQHGNIFGRLAETESAARTLTGFEESVARQLLQDLGQKMRRNAGFAAIVLAKAYSPGESAAKCATARTAYSAERE